MRRLLLGFLLASTLGQAETAPFTPKSRPFTLSLFGPLSTNLGSYDETNTYVCLGLINCSTYSVQGLSIAYGFNVTGESMYGLGLSVLGNHVGGDSKGLLLSFLGNFTVGAAAGGQVGAMNFAMGSVAGFQAGLLNVIGGANSHSPAFGVPIGFVNVSLQRNTIPMGFVNIIRGGRLSIDFSQDPLGFNRLLVLTGSQYAYTVLCLPSRRLNPSHASHMDSVGFYGGGFGGAVPMRELTVRMEYIYYTPSGLTGDLSDDYRVLLEWQKSVFTLYGGVEHLRFRRGQGERSYLDDRAGRRTSLAVGATVNLLGWWK